MVIDNITNIYIYVAIQNESHAKVSSFGGGVKYDGGSSAESGKTQSGNTPHTSNGPNASNAALVTNATPQGLVMGMPSFASSSQSDTGVTRATLTPGTLILNKDSHPTVTDIKSLGINTELSLANQQVDKPNIDKLKENQEIAALTGQVGSFAVGELGQRMGLEEGSWQKAALHGAVGALSAQLSKGNVKAGAHSEQESDQDQSLARKYSRQANSLTSAMAENYTSGTGLFSLKELYANKDPLAKAMFESITESGYAIGVVSSTRMIFKDAKIGNFVSKDKLLSHFDKHSGEFCNLYTTPTDYLIGARYVMNLGIPVEYMYKGELRNGFIKYLGNTSKKGEAKFAFVGTNLDHNITTYHTKSGKEFWRLLNNDYTHKVIYPKGEKK